MSDLVKRLRHAVIYGTSHPEMYKTPEDDRIEQLTADLAAERETVNAAVSASYVVREQRDAALAALKVAREALVPYAAMYGGPARDAVTHINEVLGDRYA